MGMNVDANDEPTLFTDMMTYKVAAEVHQITQKNISP